MAGFAKNRYALVMSTMNISLPAELKEFVDERVEDGGYQTTSEFLRDLIRREQERVRFRNLIQEGLDSPPGPIADAKYFTAMRRRIKRRK